jgi:hypothetical protein
MQTRPGQTRGTLPRKAAVKLGDAERILVLISANTLQSSISPERPESRSRNAASLWLSCDLDLERSLLSDAIFPLRYAKSNGFSKKASTLNRPASIMASGRLSADIRTKHRWYRFGSSRTVCSRCVPDLGPIFTSAMTRPKYCRCIIMYAMVALVVQLMS